MEKIFNRFQRIQKRITIEDLKYEIQEIKKQIDKLKQENEHIRNLIQYKQKNFAETFDNQDSGIIIPNKQAPIETFINKISKNRFLKMVYKCKNSN